MAIDFMEEGRGKRLLTLRIAKEAQRELFKRVSSRMVIEAKKREADEERRRREAVIELEQEIMPEGNGNNMLQKMVSMSGIFNEAGQAEAGGMMMNWIEEENNDPFFNNDGPMGVPSDVFGNDPIGVGYNDDFQLGGPVSNAVDERPIAAV